MSEMTSTTNNRTKTSNGFVKFFKKHKVLTIASIVAVVALIGGGTATAILHSDKISKVENRVEAVEQVVAMPKQDTKEIGELNMVTTLVEIINRDGVNKGYIKGGARISGDIKVEPNDANNTTTVLCEITEASGEKKIASFVFSGVAVDTADELFDNVYDLSSTQIKALTKIEKPYQSINNLYNETILAGLKTEASDPIADIQSKLAQIWELSDGQEIMARSSDSTVDGINIYSLEIRVDGNENQSSEYVKFQQNSNEDIATFYKRIDMTMSDEPFNGSFGVSFSNPADRIDFYKRIIEINKPAATPSEGETQTGTEGGASTSDPNASI